MFLEKYPDNDKEKFPRGTEASGSFNKDRIQNKLKRIKLNFRKAVDKGRRIGGEKWLPRSMKSVVRYARCSCCRRSTPRTFNLLLFVSFGLKFNKI